jgi:site-specific DNA-cytosine methylase
LHPEAHRPITVREAALLQSFPRRHAKPPNGFIFPEDLPMTAVSKGIGNAVPPALARAVARAVAAHSLARPDEHEVEREAA